MSKDIQASPNASLADQREYPAPLNDLQASFCTGFKVIVCLYSRSAFPVSVFLLLITSDKLFY